MNTLLGILISGALSLGAWQMKDATAADAQWLDVSVPTTVLAAYVDNGVYPDPRMGLNEYLIPPIESPHIFRTRFVLPRELRTRKHLRLRFDGLNYRADISLNGTRIADADSVVGMFRRFTFDISELVDRRGENVLEVTVHPVDHPGTTLPGSQKVVFGSKRGSARDLFGDVTLKMGGGWDCAPIIADRYMGITLPVSVFASDEVSIGDPTFVSKVSDGSAHVSVSAPLISDVSGEAKWSLKLNDGEKNVIVRSGKIALKAGENLFSTDFELENPKLWWPNGYGDANLYNLELSIALGGRVSDRISREVGVREIRTELLERDGEHGLVMIVNGVRVFLRGGWIQPDALLRDSPESIAAQARLIADAGINIVGSEDMPTMPEEWLEAFDRNGLLYWHVFEQCWRTYPGSASAHNPLDHDLAEVCVRDEISRYRCHPSIASWVCANEVVPDEDLYMRIRAAVAELDPSRPFIPTTSVDWDVEALTPWLAADLPTGTTDAGAPDYNWAPSEYYFEKVNEVYLQMFRNELGMPSMPSYESLSRFITTLDKPFDPSDPLWPLDSLWAEHGAWDGNNFCYRSYDNAIRTLYGDPTSARDYVRKGEIVSAEGYRAMFEAANHRMWDITTGVMIWKLNSCWPDVCWQLYDWYLGQTAAYFHVKKALEPVHVQLNAHDFAVSVINASLAPVSGSVLAEVYDLRGRVIASFSAPVSLGAQSYRECLTLPKIYRGADEYIVRLRLMDGSGCVSENVYWKYSQHQSHFGLMHMPRQPLSIEWAQEGETLTVTLSNRGEGISFFNKIVALDPDGKVISPINWSDNYITVFPDESVRITGRVLSGGLSGELRVGPSVGLSGGLSGEPRVGQVVILE